MGALVWMIRALVQVALLERPLSAEIRTALEGLNEDGLEVSKAIERSKALIALCEQRDDNHSRDLPRPSA